MASEAKTGYWLFKQEPDCYSFSDLEKDGRTLWDGVRNALALQHLRRIRPGDRVLFYHTGKEKAVVGEMVVVGASANPEHDPPTVEVEPVRRLTAVSLAQIKEDPALRDWDLLRLPRLSVVPVTAQQWQRIHQLAGSGQ